MLMKKCYRTLYEDFLKFKSLLILVTVLVISHNLDNCSIWWMRPMSPFSGSGHYNFIMLSSGEYLYVIQYNMELKYTKLYG